MGPGPPLPAARYHFSRQESWIGPVGWRTVWGRKTALSTKGMVRGLRTRYRFVCWVVRRSRPCRLSKSRRDELEWEGVAAERVLRRVAQQTTARAGHVRAVLRRSRGGYVLCHFNCRALAVQQAGAGVGAGARMRNYSLLTRPGRLQLPSVAACAVLWLWRNFSTAVKPSPRCHHHQKPIIMDERNEYK